MPTDQHRYGRTVKPWAKLAAYGLLLAAALGTGAAVGSVVGPIDVGGDAPHDTTTSVTSTTEAHDGDSDH